jgi:hypothetical protein
MQKYGLKINTRNREAKSRMLAEVKKTIIYVLDPVDQSSRMFYILKFINLLY